jgi:hypothetical protein
MKECVQNVDGRVDLGLSVTNGLRGAAGSVAAASASCFYTITDRSEEKASVAEMFKLAAQCSVFEMGQHAGHVRPSNRMKSP